MLFIDKRLFKYVFTVTVFLSMVLAGNNKKIKISSPDNKNKIEFEIRNGRLFYKLLRNNSIIIDKSTLGYRLKTDVNLTDNFIVKDVKYSESDEFWTPVAGTDAKVRNNYKQAQIELISSPDNSKMILFFRAYNDGVAFRYFVPEQKNLTNVEILDEETEFNFTDDHYGWWITNDYSWDENFYKKNKLSDIAAVNTPVTIETKKGLYLSINEAALYDYPAMTLEKNKNKKYGFKAVLVPWPDGIRVKTKTPFYSPWRTVQIADRPGALAESHLAENLNEPNKLEDTSWIKPMKFIGIWWGMHIQRWTWEAGSKHGATTENVKRYIDFAAKHNIDAVLVEGWNEGWETWKANTESMQYYTKPYPDFNISEISEYAKSKNVMIMGHHETGGNIVNYENQLDSAFSYYKKYGINSVKTGYAGGDFPRGKHHFGQAGVNHYNYVVKKAADYKMMLNVHEPIKPTGINRTYPHLMTQEGARGNEQNSPTGNHIPPEHHTIIPFTRLLTGGYDYTTGIFKLKNDENPAYHISGTLAKELSLYVIIFSPMQMIADMIENLENQPALKFVKDVPVTWDETKVLDSKIGDYVTFLRRKGNEWYLGSASDENSRLLNIPLNFLEKNKKYIAEFYMDGMNTDWYTKPSEIQIDSCIVTTGDNLKLALACAGGAALRIRLFNNENIKDYKSIAQINKEAETKALHFRNGLIYGKMKINNPLVTKAEAKYKINPSIKYYSGGSKGLIDGLIGSATSFENWQGFEEDDLEIILDLGAPKDAKKITLNFLRDHNNWIFIPSKINIEVSADNKSFKSIATFTGVNNEDMSGRKVETFSTENSQGKIRYLKIRANNIKKCPDWHYGKGGKAWIFTDEIIVE